MSLSSIAILPRASSPAVSPISACSASNSSLHKREVLPPCHCVAGLRELGADPVAEVLLRIGAVEVVRVHLDVGVELLQRVGRARVAAEEHAGVDVAELDLDADLVPPLLDQRLRRLAHRVGRGLVEDRQPLAVLRRGRRRRPSPSRPRRAACWPRSMSCVLHQSLLVEALISGAGTRLQVDLPGLAVAGLDQDLAVDGERTAP